MVKNVGQMDRIGRVVVAVIALFVAWQAGFSGALGVIALVVAVAMGVTAAVGTCPIYRIFGINTCKISR